MNWILGIGIFLLAAGAIALLVRYFIIRSKGELEWLLVTTIFVLAAGVIMSILGLSAEIGDCPQCGYDYPSGDYCSQCGYEIYKTCDYCDKSLYYKDKYCSYCGKKL